MPETEHIFSYNLMYGFIDATSILLMGMLSFCFLFSSSYLSFFRVLCVTSLYYWRNIGTYRVYTASLPPIGGGWWGIVEDPPP